MKILNKKFIIPNLLIMPMVSHWLLPSGIETKCYLDFLGISLYIPNISYVLYIIFYKFLGIKLPIIRNIGKTLVIPCTLLLIYCTLSIISLYEFDYIDEINIIFSDLSIVYFPIIFYLFPLDKKNLEKTKWLIIPSLLIICLEIYLYGLGILVYESSTGKSLGKHVYGGVMRISTTIGGATGTAVIIVILGIITTSFYRISQLFKLLIIVTTSIAILFTVSRGGILSWSIYLFILFYKDYYKKFKLRQKSYSIIGLLVLLFLFDYYGAFEPLKQRNQIMETQDVTSGRGDKYGEAIKMLIDTDFLGYGPAMVFADKSIQEIIVIQHKNALHNMWLIYLTELGIIGFILVLSIYIIMIYKIKYNLPMGIMCIILLIINGNTEGVIAHSEYVAPLILLFLMSNKYLYGQKNPIYCFHKSI